MMYILEVKNWRLLKLISHYDRELLEPVISDLEGNELARRWCETLARLLSRGDHRGVQLSGYLLPVLCSFDQNHGEDELIQIQLPVSVTVGQLPNFPQRYMGQCIDW